LGASGIPCLPASRVWSHNCSVSPTTFGSWSPAGAFRARIAATVEESTPPDMATAMVCCSANLYARWGIRPPAVIPCKGTRGDEAVRSILFSHHWDSGGRASRDFAVESATGGPGNAVKYGLVLLLNLEGKRIDQKREPDGPKRYVSPKVKPRGFREWLWPVTLL